MAIETNLYYVIFKNESAKLCSEYEAAEIMETDDNAIECGPVDEIRLEEELPWLLSYFSDEDEDENVKKLREILAEIRLW